MGKPPFETLTEILHRTELTDRFTADDRDVLIRIVNDRARALASFGYAWERWGPIRRFLFLRMFPEADSRHTNSRHFIAHAMTARWAIEE